MKTKAQKVAQVEKGVEGIGSNKTLVFADFTGTTANQANTLRKSLHGLGARFEVFKKRLLRVAFEKKGIAVNPEDFSGQVGVAFSQSGIDVLAGAMYNFGKQNKNFKLLGGLDTVLAKFFSGEEVTAIGALPPREILLAHVVGTIASPMSAFLYVLGERAKQVK